MSLQATVVVDGYDVEDAARYLQEQGLCDTNKDAVDVVESFLSYCGPLTQQELMRLGPVIAAKEFSGYIERDERVGLPLPQAAYPIGIGCQCTTCRSAAMHVASQLRSPLKKS